MTTSARCRIVIGGLCLVSFITGPASAQTSPAAVTCVVADKADLDKVCTSVCAEVDVTSYHDLSGKPCASAWKVTMRCDKAGELPRFRATCPKSSGTAAPEWAKRK
jgi:hypothetical protein